MQGGDMKLALKLVPIIICMIYAQACWGQVVYKCETAEGVEFSIQPCGEDARKVSGRGQSGGIDEFANDRPEDVVGGSEAKAHDGPILKSLRHQNMERKMDRFSALKALAVPELEKCGKFYDEVGNIWYVPCED